MSALASRHVAKLSLDGVTKSFGSKQVLRGLDLTVAEHEVVCLIGPSGCGKSTVLRCIDLLEPIDGGQILFEGVDITGPGVRANDIRRRIGIVFQSFNLFPHLNVLDNVTLGARRARKVGRREAEEQARALLTRFGLGDRALDFPNKLSGGQNQRAAIVRALMGDPELLLLDEITSALDPELVGEVLGVIRDLAEQGMTMVLATHEMGFARDVASRVCFLDQGRVLEEGPPGELFRAPIEERTQRFLARVVESGRLAAPLVPRMPAPARGSGASSSNEAPLSLAPPTAAPPTDPRPSATVLFETPEAGAVPAGAWLVTDPEELVRFFADDLRVHIYAVADLCEPFWSGSTWWRRDDAVVGLVHLPASGDRVVYAVSSRAPEATLALLGELMPQLPAGALITGPEGLGDLLARDQLVAWHRAYHRYWLPPDVVLPPRSPRAETLGPDDVGLLEQLYRVDPGAAFFRPSMVDDGTFVGCRLGSRLVAAAGTHVVLDAFGLRAGAIGAVFTHPELRGQGLARLLTAAVCHELRQHDSADGPPMVIGLNCAEPNVAARRVYQQLGFVPLLRYEEAQLSSAAVRSPGV